MVQISLTALIVNAEMILVFKSSQPNVQHAMYKSNVNVDNIKC